MKKLGTGKQRAALAKAERRMQRAMRAEVLGKTPGQIAAAMNESLRAAHDVLSIRSAMK